MTDRAQDFCRSLRCVVIGVGTYQASALAAIPGALRNAIDFGAALVSPTGAAVPPEQVKTLTDGQATRREILGAFETTCMSAASGDRLIIYYAGHGTRSADGMLYLCAHDTDLANLATTAIGGADLVALLERSPATTVLVVVDCCRGAGLTEAAPRFFTRSTRGTCRILLSASEVDEPSWDLPDGSGTMFSRCLVDVVAGRESPGRNAGLVYFSELLEHIQVRVDEHMRVLHPDVPRQTAVFVGAYARDPLLFVRPARLGQRTRIVTARYSRQYLLQTLRRVLVVVALALLVAAAIAYSVLDHTEFARVENNRITIYRGSPSLSLFGFPHLEFETDWTTADLQQDADLFGGPVAAPLGHPVLPNIVLELRPPSRSTAEFVLGQRTSAIALASEALRHPGSETDLVAIGVLSATVGDRALNEDLAKVGGAQARSLAIATEFDVAPARALALTQTIPTKDIESHVRILRALIGSCRPEITAYLGRMLAEAPDDVTYESAIDAAIRLDCVLSKEQFRAAVHTEGRLSTGPYVGPGVAPLGDAGYYATVESRADLTSALSDDFEAGHFAGGDEAAALMALAYIDISPCEPDFVSALSSNNPRIAKAAAYAVAAHCPDATQMIPAGLRRLEAGGREYDDANLTDFLATHQRLSATELLSLASSATSTIERSAANYAMIGVPCNEQASIVGHLLQDAQTESDYRPPGIPQQDRVAALIALDILDVDPEPVEHLVTERYSRADLPDPVHNVPMEAAVWFGRRYPHKLVEIASLHLAEPDGDYWIHALGRSPLSVGDVEQFGSRIGTGESVADARNISVFAIKADETELANLLTSPYWGVRSIATQYVAGNERYLESACDRVSATEAPSFAPYASCNLAAWGRAARHELARVPSWAVQWRASRWISAGSEVSAGLVILVNEEGRKRLMSERARVCQR